MPRTIALACALLAMALPFGLMAQSGHAEEPAAHDRHEHPPSEIGLAGSAAWFTGEERLQPGFHAHFLRAIGHTPFRLGLGYERIFSRQAHNAVGLLAGYAVAHGWTVLLAPGVSFEDEEPAALHPTVHLETTYEFDLGRVHLGPVLEWAWDPEDAHISLGLHVGIGLGGHEHR